MAPSYLNLPSFLRSLFPRRLQRRVNDNGCVLRLLICLGIVRWVLAGNVGIYIVCFWSRWLANPLHSKIGLHRIRRDVLVVGYVGVIRRLGCVRMKIINSWCWLGLKGHPLKICLRIKLRRLRICIAVLVRGRWIQQVVHFDCTNTFRCVRAFFFQYF